jgi:hypothetical protein
VKAIFYADDGHLYSTNADALQLAADLIIELFEHMGLQTNPTKNKNYDMHTNATLYQNMHTIIQMQNV